MSPKPNRHLRFELPQDAETRRPWLAVKRTPMKPMVLLLALLAFGPAAEADEIDDILNSGAALEITASELNEIFKGVKHEGFKIERHAFMDVAGVYAEKDMVLSAQQLSCAVSQLKALKQVDWKKFSSTPVQIGLNTKRHMMGNSLRPEFRHDKETLDPASAEIEIVHLLHVYHPEHDKCDVWDKTRIEARLEENLAEAKSALAAAKEKKEEGEKLAEDSLAKKQRLIELLQKSSLNGRSPAVFIRPGECESGQTICAQNSAVKYDGSEPVGRQPAFLGTVKNVD